MIRALMLGLAALSSAGAAGPPPVHFHLEARAPVVRTLKEFSFQYYQERAGTGTLVVHRAEWELRDVYRHRRVARIPAQMYFYEGVRDERPPHPEGARYGFSDDDLRHIGPVEPGNYEMALLIDGKRAPNVTAFQVDPNFDAAKAPVLTVGLEEAPPGAKVGSLLVWIVGPNPFDKDFTNFEVAFGAITVDGVEHKPDALVWTGPVGPYSTGETDVRTYDTAYRLKGVDVSKPHDFSVQVGKYGSAVAKLNLSGRDLAREWDAATGSLGEVPDAKPLLTGTVTGPDGRPATGWEIALSRAGGEHEVERIDERGRYAFSRVPPGEYTLGCAPISSGTLTLDCENFKVGGDSPRTYDITFAGKNAFSGRVTDAGGKPLAGVAVDGEWKDPATGAEMHSEAVTASDGSYRLASPFSVITYVGLSNNGTPRPNPRYDVKPGMTHVDFVVPAR